jgi:hypothetical protein
MDPIADVEAGFRKVLDSHGFGFHYSVLTRAEELQSRSKSTWVFEVSEFPVSVAAGSARIDFVLRQPETRSYLIAECKRANPSLSNWCFARAPLVGRNMSAQPYMVERARHFHGNVRAEGYALTHSCEAFHIALEIRSHEKGDSYGPGRGAIEDAVTQVLKGTNGFVNFLASKPSLVPENTSSLVLPVVFTTAKLWTSDAALARADVSTGRIDFAGTALKEVPWLIHQHFQSPELAHEVTGKRESRSVSKILEVDYMRSIAIVSPDGIEDFLRWSSLTLDSVAGA